MDDMLLRNQEIQVPLPTGIWRYYLNKLVGEKQDGERPNYG